MIVMPFERCLLRLKNPLESSRQNGLKPPDGFWMWPIVLCIITTFIFMIRKYYLLGAVLALWAWSGSGFDHLARGRFTAVAKQTEAARWQPNPDRGTATSTLSGGHRGNVVRRCTPGFTTSQLSDESDTSDTSDTSSMSDPSNARLIIMRPLKMKGC